MFKALMRRIGPDHIVDIGDNDMMLFATYRISKKTTIVCWSNAFLNPPCSITILWQSSMSVFAAELRKLLKIINTNKIIIKFIVYLAPKKPR